MRRENRPKLVQRVNVTFTKKQIELIDELINSGELGGNREEVIKQIVMFYLKENDKKSTFS